ncbi:MAG: twin-arginine translocase subunit TatC [Candidatus Coatesbacteria bacterium]
MASSPRLTILGHLAELRRRLLICLAAWLVACAAVWPRALPLLDWLLAPLGEPAIYLGPAGGFMAVVKLDFVLGALLASPVWLWQVSAFLSPALKARERRLAALAGFVGSGMFLLGSWFAYRFLLPAMMTFLLGFRTEHMRPQVTVDQYLQFLVWTVGGCGVAFEFPVVSAALAKAGILRSRALLRQWRLAIIACLVIAAWVTPSPDAGTMLMLAVPLVALYFAGIVTAWLVERGTTNREVRRR